MNVINKLPYYLIPAILLCMLVKLLYPYLGYYIDPDAVSYLTLVDRYLHADYAQAVNAFWSPMGIWLTVLLVKATHLSHFDAALVINTIAALGVVLASQNLFNRFRNNNWEQFCFGLTSAMFWATTVYRQSFTDLWQCLFLLIALCILLRADFQKRFYWWMGLGVVAALAYFSKAFSFYFLPLLTFVTLIIKEKQHGKIHYANSIKITSIVALVMIVCSLPWLIALHDKYGIWTASTAGKMNLSWWILGRPNFNDDIKILIPPIPYSHSLYYFEDAYLLEKPTIAFWNSPHYFLKQLVRVGYNSLEWVRCANLISPFYFVTWLIAVCSIFIKKITFFPYEKWRIIVATFLIFPLPYWLMTFDGGRYLWFTMPLSMILGLSFFEKIFLSQTNNTIRSLFVAIFFFSYLPGTILETKSIWNDGKDDFLISNQLDDLNIKGSFVANNIVTSDIIHRSLRIAYWTQNPIYVYGENNWTTQEILNDAARYNVKYYFYWYSGAGDDYQLRDQEGFIYPEITNGKIKGLKVFEINQ